MEPAEGIIVSYLAPLAIRSIDSLDELREVEIEGIGTNADNRSIFLMKLLDLGVVVAASDHGETPQVRQAYPAGSY